MGSLTSFRAMITKLLYQTEPVSFAFDLECKHERADVLCDTIFVSVGQILLSSSIKISP